MISNINLQNNMYLYNINNNKSIGIKVEPNLNTNSIGSTVLKVNNNSSLNKVADIVNNLFDQRSELLERIKNLKNGDDPIIESLHNEIENLKKNNKDLPDKYKKNNSNYQNYNKNETLNLESTKEIIFDSPIIDSSIIKDSNNYEFKHILQSNEGYMKEFKENGKAMAELNRDIINRYRELDENSTDINSDEYIELLKKQLNDIEKDISNLPQGSILNALIESY